MERGSHSWNKFVALTQRANADNVKFNIEIKMRPGSSQFANTTQTAKALVDAIRRAEMSDRSTVQSFDWRTLVAVKTLAPEIQTAALSAQQR